MIVKIGMSLALALAGAAVYFNQISGTGGSEAHRLVDAGASLLDVRTPEEFSAGHIASAVNLPVHELSERLGELGPKDQGIVVYCRSGVRSARAARILRDAGYAAVHDLGPMSNWRRSDSARQPAR